MNVKVKKAISVFLVVILSLITKGEALAANNKPYPLSSSLSDSIEPFWDNTTSVEVNLSFSGSKAICGACVIGKVNATKITATVVLARKNSNGTYTTVKTWSGLQTTDYVLIFDGTYYVSTGYTYRLNITSTVYNSDSSETVSASFEAYAS